MTIDAMKLTMHFQPANARTACRNCKHGHEEIADRSPPYDTKTWKCKRGGFRTTAMAVCDDHVRETAAATAAKQGGSNARL